MTQESELNSLAKKIVAFRKELLDSDVPYQEVVELTRVYLQGLFAVTKQR